MKSVTVGNTKYIVLNTGQYIRYTQRDSKRAKIRRGEQKRKFERTER